MPQDVATMLLYGLQIDTNYLRRGVSELDLDVFPTLYRLVDHSRLELLETRNLEFSDLQAFGSAINNIKIFGRVGFAFIPFSCPDDLIAQVADFILSLVEVDVAVICSRKETGFKFSVRSAIQCIHSGHLLTHAMAPYGSGGGHAKMAGGFIPISGVEQSGRGEEVFLDEVQEVILQYVAEHCENILL